MRYDGEEDMSQRRWSRTESVGMMGSFKIGEVGRRSRDEEGEGGFHFICISDSSASSPIRHDALGRSDEGVK